ncbi:PRA-PH-domain-containing protein, partial [Atractiella rhizophila]
LWTKGMTSGAVQEILRIRLDCDGDALQFIVRQTKGGFCHIPEQESCFGDMGSFDHLEMVIKQRKEEAAEGSYTKRLFDEPGLLKAKIMEEAQELCDATTEKEVAEECADLLYFALTKCVSAGVGLEEVSKVLEKRKGKVARRKGDAKKPWADKLGLSTEQSVGVPGGLPTPKEKGGAITKTITLDLGTDDDTIRPRIYSLKDQSPSARADLTKRPRKSTQ